MGLIEIHSDVWGEPIRHDMRESQPGVELILDVQVINTKTCQPLQNVYIEFWSCNATVSFIMTPSIHLYPFYPIHLAFFS